jgi:hypothetical protein
MRRWAKRLVCRYFSHDWWALAYPPARRWECHRCGAIVEETARAGTGFAVSTTPEARDPLPVDTERPGKEESSGTR